MSMDIDIDIALDVCVCVCESPCECVRFFLIVFNSKESEAESDEILRNNMHTNTLAYTHERVLNTRINKIKKTE